VRVILSMRLARRPVKRRRRVEAAASQPHMHLMAAVPPSLSRKCPPVPGGGGAARISWPEIRRIALLCVGGVLIVASPAVGVLPGPGGILVFALGLALLLRNSRRMKRRYVMAKKRWPRLGRWCDRGLWRRRKPLRN